MHYPDREARQRGMERKKTTRGLGRLGLIAGLGALLAGALTTPAAAQGSLSTGDHVPIEQRVALAIGPDRTTLWTQLLVRTKPGPLAVVVPAAPGASLDWSSPAWMEALELATAPRIRPPSGVVPACPGEVPPDDPVDVIGQTTHIPPLPPLEVTVLSDADAVVTWAQGYGMTVPPPVVAAMNALAGQRFVVARFDAPDGEVLTPTLRVVSPTPSPTLPLILTRATTDDLLVTAFTLGEGRALLDGAAVSVDPTLVTYDAADATTSYADARWTALMDGGTTSSVLECATRSALAGQVAVGVGDHVIESAITTYFTRAAAYEGGAFDASACIAGVDPSVDTPATVAEACPRADLGVVEGSDTCVETVGAGELDPSLLRCGLVADDLAVALSGQVASSAWLSRHSAWVPMALTGTLRTVGVEIGPAVQPIVDADTVDASGCGGEGGEGGAGGTGTGMGTGGAGGTGTGTGASSSGAGGAGVVRVPVYEVDSGCGADDIGTVPIFYVDWDASDDYPYAYYVEQEGCGGDTTDSYETDAFEPIYEEDVEGNGYADEIAEETGSNDCTGDTSDSYADDDGDCGGDTSDSYEGDSYDDGGDCGGDTSDTGDSYDDGGDCGGDTSDTSDSGDDCGGDTSDTGDDGCSIARRRPRRRPRLSVIVMALLGLVAPLRRVTRPSERRRRSSLRVRLRRLARSLATSWRR